MGSAVAPSWEVAPPPLVVVGLRSRTVVLVESATVLSDRPGHAIAIVVLVVIVLVVLVLVVLVLVVAADVDVGMSGRLVAEICVEVGCWEIRVDAVEPSGCAGGITGSNVGAGATGCATGCAAACPTACATGCASPIVELG